MKFKFTFAPGHIMIGAVWDPKNCTLSIFPLPMLGIKIRVWGRRCYVMRKRGLYYRPNDCGYTSCIGESGRYTYDEAKKREYLHGDEKVTMHHIGSLMIPL